ncbi:hypothetical protein [uncultured Cocleimonas sp.]|nr:hypothetical protein [uncultured Cocleimonas sp.]
MEITQLLADTDIDIICEALEESATEKVMFEMLWRFILINIPEIKNTL